MTSWLIGACCVREIKRATEVNAPEHGSTLPLSTEQQRRPICGKLIQQCCEVEQLAKRCPPILGNYVGALDAPHLMQHVARVYCSSCRVQARYLHSCRLPA